MESSNAKVKRKHSLEMEPTKERKCFKISTQVISTQDINPINSGDDKTSDKKKQDLVMKFSWKEKNLEKAPGPGNNGYPESCTGAADEKHDKAPPKQFTRIGKSACNETRPTDQEGCVAVSPKLEAHAGFVDRVREGPSFHSQEKLLPEKMECRKSLKASMTQLKDETFRLSRHMQKYAAKCEQLTEANTLLLDELRNYLDPCVIQILEAMNPDPEYRSKFSTDKEGSLQNRKSPSELSPQ